MVSTVQAVVERVNAGMTAAAESLFALRHPNGFWQDTLPSAAVATGAAVMALRVGEETGEETGSAASAGAALVGAALVRSGTAWLRTTQLPDGGWGDTVGGPATLNATAIGTAALAFADPDRSAEPVRRGLERLERFGGLAAVTDQSHCSMSTICQLYLALAGLHDISRVPRLPFEVILLPRRLWGRLSSTVPCVMSWGLMQAHTQPPSGRARRFLAARAEPKALRYLAGIQEYEGPTGGFEESPLMAALVYLGLSRAGTGTEIAAHCRDYLHTTVRPDGSWAVDRDITLSVTTYITAALADAGLGTDPRLGVTAAWIRASQRRVPFFATGAPAGGWGWAMPSGWPDTEDTASALIALSGLGVGAEDEQVRRGVDWLRAMQRRNGSWGCFTRNTGITLDGPCPFITARALEALNATGAARGPVRGAARNATTRHGPVRRAVRWLERAQRPDGSIPALWFRDLTCGTATALGALGQLGLAHLPVAARCRHWLITHQHEDGSWSGTGARHGAEPGTEPGAQLGTVEETAWALLALIRSGLPAEHPALVRGVGWLLDHQRDDALWDPSVVGVYFMDLLYSDDHLANGFALQALAGYRNLATGNTATGDPGTGPGTGRVG